MQILKINHLFENLYELIILIVEKYLFCFYSNVCLLAKIISGILTVPHSN